MSSEFLKCLVLRLSSRECFADENHLEILKHRTCQHARRRHSLPFKSDEGRSRDCSNMLNCCFCSKLGEITFSSFVLVINWFQVIS